MKQNSPPPPPPSPPTPPPPPYNDTEEATSTALSQLTEAVPSATFVGRRTAASSTTGTILSTLGKGDPEAAAGEKDKEGDTIFYLAYGSNMCAATFLGRRGIRPISATNVVVPDLRLTFGLPGVAYIEPCFANVRLSSPSPASGAGDNEANDDSNDNDDGWWPGGLMGVVYEVTREDYAKIIATEGGGAGYQVVHVRALRLPLDDATDDASREAIPACTLCAPAKLDRGRGAQPSERYLRLLRTGAREHGLPAAYQDWLARLQPYRATTARQKAGVVIWATAWLPVMVLVTTLTAALADAQGRSPDWVRGFQGCAMRVHWLVYDSGFSRVFGDGERGTPERGTVAAGGDERGGL